MAAISPSRRSPTRTTNRPSLHVAPVAPPGILSASGSRPNATAARTTTAGTEATIEIVPDDDPRGIPCRDHLIGSAHQLKGLDRRGPRHQERSHDAEGPAAIARQQREGAGMTVHRMDHAGVVVEDLAAAVSFFVELGLELEGETTVEGEWVDQLVGLDGVRADLAFLRIPDGVGRVELSMFHTPVASSAAPRAPMNTRASLASRSSSTPSTTSSTACAPTAPNSWARWRSTGTSTGTATSAAPTASSSGWSRSSAERQSEH